MKIAYLNPTGQLGGAERVLLDIMASLRAADPNYQPHLIAASDGPLVTEARALGVPATVIPFPATLARLGDGGAGGSAGNQVGSYSLLGRLTRAAAAASSYLISLRRALRQIAPDLIHTNGFKMHLLGMWARPRRTPVIWHIHDYISARPLMSRLLPPFAKRCGAVIAVSNSVADDVTKVCGHRAPVRTVYNAVDVDRFSPEGPRLNLDALAGMLPAEPGTVRVGMFATMARWKGHEVFLRALSLLPADLHVRAYVVGNALYQTSGSQCSLIELRRRAKELGVSDRVGFTGFVEHVPAAMRACDVIVHASTQPEPFGLVIVEAMACGRPVIVSNAGGAAELVEASEQVEASQCATMHNPGDAQGLAAQITKLARSPRLRAELGASGTSAATRLFNRSRLSNDVLPLYRSLTGEPPWPPVGAVSLSRQ